MNDAVHYTGRPNRANVPLLPSAVRTASGTGDPVGTFGSPQGLGEFSELHLQLDVAAAGVGSGDTLDVFLQTTLDGTNWVDIHHFTQVLGNGGAKRYFAKILSSVALTEFENGASLSAANGRALLGDAYRVRWAVAGSGPPSFTFSVTGNFR